MELHFTRTNGPVDDLIDHLIRQAGNVCYPEYVREMILAALKSGQECEDRIDLKIMNSTLKEMRFTNKVFSPYRGVRKVTVFGSARTRPEERIYGMAQEFGRRLAGAGYMVITGGGPGIMQAVNEGAGPENSFGVNIRLPFEQEMNPVLANNPRAINYKYFFNRKVAFLKESDAVALFPGGFGTLDEAMETLTLVQTGKRAPLPLVLIDEPGGTYWARYVDFLKEELLATGYISEMDLDLFDRSESPDEAVQKVGFFYSRYHSLRYVGEKLVIRLLTPLGEESVGKLTADFADILVPNGRIALSEALPAELEEPDIAHLPRVVVDFDRKDFARLRHLIDAINRL
ncbi:MAG: TIGR00730 family Rossman fold protein [Deltaproteobacteria bacterium]